MTAALRVLAACTLLAGPASADIARFLDDDQLPGLAAFVEKTEALKTAAAADCTREAVLPAYNAAFDAWMPVADMRLGPSEQAAISIAFWPDDRGFTQKGLRRMIAAEDPAGRDPVAYADASAATRGLMALDMMLGDPDFAYQPGSYSCALVQTISADLAAQAKDLAAGWTRFQAELRQPGQGEALTYLDQAEALRAIYTQIIAGLGFTVDNRLGRPLGTFEAPRPKRAEAWRTGRPLPDILGAARAAHRHAAMLADGPMPMADAALAQVEEAAARIPDPTLAEVADPTGRLRIEALQQRVTALKQAIEQELGAAQNITAGFNAADGD